MHFLTIDGSLVGVEFYHGFVFWVYFWVVMCFYITDYDKDKRLKPAFQFKIQFPLLSAFMRVQTETIWLFNISHREETTQGMRWVHDWGYDSEIYDLLRVQDAKDAKFVHLHPALTKCW